MNRRDLLDSAYYNAYNQKRSQTNMDRLVNRAVEKDVNVFDPLILKKSIQIQDYINEIIIDGLIKKIKGDYDLPPDFHVNVLFRDRDDFSANMEKASDNSNEHVIFVDDLLDSCIFSLTSVFAYWNDSVENVEIWTKCFKYTIYVLTEFSAKRIRPAAPPWVYEMTMEMLTYSEGAVHLLADINSIITGFILAHELGHFVLGHHTSMDRIIENEYEADDFAYEIILSMIENQEIYISEKGKRPMIDMYSGNAYLAPLLFFDFMQLMEFFRNSVYNDFTWQNATQELAERKAHLETWVYDSPDIYKIETSDGNKVYNAFLNSIDRFTDEVKWKLQRGKSLIPESESIPHAVATEIERLPFEIAPSSN